MSDKHLEFINDWRRDNPRLAIVNSAFYARDEAFKSFSALVADDISPHLLELGIMPSSLLGAYAWCMIIPQIEDCQNFYRHGLVYLIHQGLRQEPECFDEMLNLEALCWFELRIRKAWPELCERLRNYVPSTRKQIADLVTYRRKLPWLGPEPIPPLPEHSLTLEYLRMSAEGANIAAYSRFTSPETEEALRLHPSYDFAQRLFKLSLDRLACAASKPLIEYLSSHNLLPNNINERALFLKFLEELNPHALPLFFPEVLVLIPESTSVFWESYEHALVPHTNSLRKFMSSISMPIKNLSDIPFAIIN